MKGGSWFFPTPAEKIAKLEAENTELLTKQDPTKDEAHNKFYKDKISANEGKIADLKTKLSTASTATTPTSTVSVTTPTSIAPTKSFFERFKFWGGKNKKRASQRKRK